MTTALTFNEISFIPVPVHNNDSIWLRASDISRALGYQREDKVSRLYQRNADEFTPDMTQVIEIIDNPTSGVTGNLTTTARIFSLRGCHLLAMFSRTPVAKAFRKWVLDVLDRIAAEERTTLSTSPAALTPSTADDRKPLRSLVHAWAQIAGTSHTALWPQVKAHFQLARIDDLPVEWIGDALAFVQGKIDAMGKALPEGKQEIAESPIQARIIEKFPKDMGAGRKQALKKIEDILKLFYGLRDTVRLCVHPGGYSCGRSVSEKDRYDILMSLYHAADANLAAAYNALEAGYRLGREVGRG